MFIRFTFVFFLCFICHSQSGLGAVHLVSQNTFNVEGAIDMNIKSRNSLLFGDSGFRFGGFVHFNRPYAHHREVIYGASVVFGDTWQVGIDGGLLERTVFGQSGTGFAGALVFTYYVTSNWHFAVPIFYKTIDDGTLSQRWEANLLPYIGYDFALF